MNVPKDGLDDVLARIAERHSDDTARGREWEAVLAGIMRTDPVWADQYRHGWRATDWPGRHTPTPEPTWAMSVWT